MKKFLAVYMGSATAPAVAKWEALSESARKEKESKGMAAWGQWATANSKFISTQGAPLGKTKKVGPDGVSDIRNQMTAFTIIEAESHAAAAEMFQNHPHFSIFPGDSVEIMECLPMP